MTRLILAVVMMVALAVPVPAQETPSASFAELLHVDVVNVDVIVTDKKGVPLTGLQISDFQILEEEKSKVKITNFYEASGTGLGQDRLTLVVYVDELNLRSANRDRALAEMSAEIEGLMAEGVETMVVTHDGQLRVRQPLTGDYSKVRAAFDELAGSPTPSRSSESVGRAIAESVDQTLQMFAGSARDQRMGTSSLEGIASQLRGYAQSVAQDVGLSLHAIDSLVSALGGIPGRKAVVYVSDGLAMRPADEVILTLQDRIAGNRRGGGGDLMTSSGSGFGEQSTNQGDGGGDINTEILADQAGTPDLSLGRLQQAVDPFDMTDAYRRVAARANTNRVTFYTLKAAAGDASAAELRTQGGGDVAARLSDLRESLEYLAAATAGISSSTGSDARGFLTEMRSSLGHYYSLGFTPKQRPEGTYIPLRVKSKQRGARLRYRDGYFARSFETRLADRTVGALVLGFTENPHGLAAEVDAENLQEDGNYEVSLIVTFPIGKLTLIEQAEAHRADARVTVAIINSRGEMPPVQHLEVPLAIPAADLETAKEQLFGARVNLRLPAGDQRLALGLWDLAAGEGSFISQDLPVGGG